MFSDPLYIHVDLFNEFQHLLGSKIKFETSEGEHEGILKLLLPKRQRVIFEHVYYLPTGEFMGNLHLSLREILSYSVVEDTVKADKYDKWDYLSHVLDNNSVAIRYQVKDLFNGESENESETEEHIPYSDEIFEDEFVLHLPHHLQGKLPRDSVILNTVNLEFNQAIEYISQQSVIGVSFDGPKISRFGKLSWVSIGAPYCVFLFDIEHLGRTAFDHGLKDIFQNKKIEKVVHDCRQPSDCLSHQFDTKLINVFDTQVADFIVNMQRCKDMSFKYVSSLDCCLVSHLDVPQDFIYNRRKKVSYVDEVSFFKLRPISNDYKNVLIKDTIYLTLLKEILSEAMMSPFRRAIDVYLNVLANASEQELLIQPSVPDKIPPALIMEGIKTVQFQDSRKAEIINLQCKFKNYRQEFVNQAEIPHTSSNITIISSASEKNKVVPIISTKQKNNSLDPFDTFDLNSSSVNIPIEKKTGVDNRKLFIEKISFPNNRNHTDNVYHQLANGLSSCDVAENIDVKPSEDYISNFVARKYVTSNKASQDIPDVISDLESDSSFDLSETSLELESIDVSTDSNVSWEQFHAAFGVSSHDSEKQDEIGQRKLKFVPA